MMESKFRFTKGRILELPTPAKRTIFYDTECRGLALFVMPSGAKVFYLYKRIKGKPRQIKLGDFPDMSVENARDRAEDVRREVQAGADPVEAKRALRGEMTLGELFAWWLEAHAMPTKKTWEDDVKTFRRYLGGLSDRKLSEVTRGDMRLLHARLGKRGKLYAANRAIALMRSVYNKAIRHELATENPAEHIDMFRERSRDRRLTVSEVPAFLDALAMEPNEQLRDYILLSLYTGARQANVLAMRWDEIDFKAKSWRIPETKNGMPLVVPLEDQELAILRARLAEAESAWVFPSRSSTGHMVNPQKGWTALCERARLGSYDDKGKFHANIRLHDLRRTLGSWMADTGSSLAVVGKALGHQNQSTTAIYARLALDPIREAKRRALDAIGEAGKATDEATS